MAGTLVSIILVCAFLFGTIIQMAATPLYDRDMDNDNSSRRYVFCTLLICSNVPYLEWAHLEWRDIWKARGQEVKKNIQKGKSGKCAKWLATSIFCCEFCQRCFGIEHEEVYLNSEGDEYGATNEALEQLGQYN